MNTTMKLKSMTLIALLGVALAAPVLAQGGPGMGAGGCAAGACAQNPNAAQGGGRGMGPCGAKGAQGPRAGGIKAYFAPLAAVSR